MPVVLFALDVNGTLHPSLSIFIRRIHTAKRVITREVTTWEMCQRAQCEVEHMNRSSEMTPGAKMQNFVVSHGHRKRSSEEKLENEYVRGSATKAMFRRGQGNIARSGHQDCAR